MGKRIYWILVTLVAVAGLAVMFYYGNQPRPTPIIKISKFENHAALATAMISQLQKELKTSSVLFLGVDPDQPEHFQIWQEFLKQNQEPGMAYDMVVVEQALTTDLFSTAQKVPTKEGFAVFLQGIENAISQGHRVAVILPMVYSVQMIPMNLAQNFNSNATPQAQATSLSILDFPRSRGQEKGMKFRCIVEGVDETGLGPFGCMVAQTARAQYLKRFASGDSIGLVNQIGPKDFLLFYTQEK